VCSANAPVKPQSQFVGPFGTSPIATTKIVVAARRNGRATAALTARDWRRRFRARAPALTAAIVALAVHLDPAAVLVEGDAETAAMQALGAAWHRARRGFANRIPRLWRFWSLISGGQALGTNRSPPATRRMGAGWMAPSL
jgi:hypothetical protein